jgi:hypothetical protein
MNGEWARLLGGGDRGFFENTVKTSVWRKWENTTSYSARAGLFFILWRKQPNSGLGRLVEVSRSHIIRHKHKRPVWLLWTSDQPHRVCRYLHNTQQTQQTNIHALSGIRTRDHNNRATADLDLTATGIGRIELSLLYCRGSNRVPPEQTLEY